MATAEIGARRQEERLFAPALRATTLGLALVITLSAFEAMAVATAMPTAVRDLDGLAYYGWPFTIYLVASVIGTVTAGELSDRREPRLPLMAGLAIFAAGLVVAGAAPSMLLFVVGRGVQGFGAGTVIVAVYVVIAEVYPESLRPRVFSLTSAAWVLPSLVGPLVSGALTQYLTWRLVFLGLAPFVALGLALLWSTLPRMPARVGGDRGRDSSVDSGAGERGAGSARAAARPGLTPFAVLAAVGVAALQYAGQHIRPISLLPLACGVVVLVPALRRLLPAGTVRGRRGLPATIAVRGVLAGAFFGADSFVPLTLTDLHGYSPAAAGVPLIVGALGWSAGSWLQSRWSGVPRHHLVRVGCALIGVGVLSLLTVAFGVVPGWAAAPLWTVAGAGIGMALPTVSVLMLELSPKDERGQNTAALQICDMLSSAVCVGLGGVLLAVLNADRGATPAAIAGIDLLMAAVSGLGVLLAGRVRLPAAPAGA